MLEQWKKQLTSLSGNLTTNEAMPKRLIDKLLDEDELLQGSLSFEEINFSTFGHELDNIKGLNIVAGLQRTKREGYLTLYRGMRFPTFKRMHEMVSKFGYAFSNFEQERILDLYLQNEYVTKRELIKKDPHFWVQLQERVVHGLPVFCLVSDALQIHRAYRGENDKTVIVAIHIPNELIKNKTIKLIANTAIDFDYHNEDRDFEIQDFKDNGSALQIDYEALQTRGIDLHEMYTQDLPMDLIGAKKLGIEQDFYLLDIYKINDLKQIKDLFLDTKRLKENKDFMHGFFGDQNIIGRRPTEYLPSKCSIIKQK